MTYTNLHTAAKELGKKLYTFAGRCIDPTHTSHCFDQMARGLDYINREPAAVSVNYDGSVWLDSKAVPVVITLAGSSIFHEVEVTIELA